MLTAAATAIISVAHVQPHWSLRIPANSSSRNPQGLSQIIFFCFIDRHTVLHSCLIVEQAYSNDWPTGQVWSWSNPRAAQTGKRRKNRKKHILQAFKKNLTKIPAELKTVNATLHLASQHLTHNAARCCESVSSSATTSSPMIPTQIKVPFSTLKWKVKADDENHLTLPGKTTNRSSVHFSLSQCWNSCFSCVWDAVGWTEESQYVYGSRWVHRRHTTEHIWLFFRVEPIVLITFTTDITSWLMATENVWTSLNSWL